MKKLSTALALILCLVLCLFAFASCSKKGKTEDTTKVPDTTPGETECTHVWGEYTVDKEATCTKEGSESIYCTICEAKKDGSTRPIAKKAHTPSEDYKTVTPATCTTDGLEAKYCTVCQTVLEGEGMTRPIVAAGTDHVVTAWDEEVEATLLNQGYKKGKCSICEAPVEEYSESKPVVYLTNWSPEERAGNPYTLVNPDYKTDTTKTIFGAKSNVTSLRGSNGHFYPDESNENAGNDLLVEFSFLYNETMANATKDATLAVMYIENNNVFNIDLKTGKITARIRTAGEGGPDEYLFESPSAVSHAVSIGGYGWHRFAMRISQTAVIEADAVKYTVIATAYLDGVKIFEIDKTNYALYMHNKGTPSGLLYTATIENDALAYKDLDADGHFCDVYIMVEENYKNAGDPNPGYLVIGDLNFACGNEFKQDVVALTDPIAKTLVLDDKGTEDAADDVVVPASFFYAFADHQHDEVDTLKWTVVEEPGTLLSGAADGLQKKYCTVCGEALEEEVIKGINIEKFTTEHRDAVVLKHTFGDLLAGGKHFYPDESNNNLGNDLIIEYSLLWNDTLGNLSRAGDEKKWQVISQRLCGKGDGDENDIVWMSLCDECGGSDCPYAGGFEYGGLRTVDVGPATMSTPVPEEASYEKWPNIGGADKDNPEYGWHHVQMRVHEEVTNLDEVKAGERATYLVYVEYYLDGTLLFKLSNAPTTVNGNSTLKEKNYLYTAASDGEGGVTYTEVKDNGYVLGLRCPPYFTDSGAAYLVYADYKCFVGNEFTQDVKRVETPVADQLEVETGVNLTSTMFFEAND